VLTKDGIRTLIDVVIVDPTPIDLFPQSCTTQGFAASNVSQAKEEVITIDTLPINSSL
jgi:hypothetical protein